MLKLGGFRVLSLLPATWGEEEQFTHLCRMRKPVASIACHTLSRAQRISFAQQLRADCPEMKLIAMTTGDLDRDEEALYDALIDNLDGPTVLIDTLLRQV